MSIYQFKLPDIGEGIAEAEIAEWNVAVGDIIAEDDQLCVILTDKAAVEIPSPVAGKVSALNGEVGDMVAVGSVLVEVSMDKNEEISSQPATKNSEEKEVVQQSIDAQEKTTDNNSSAFNANHQDNINDGEKDNASHIAPNPSQTKVVDTSQQDKSYANNTNKPKNLHAYITSYKPTASPAVRKRARELGIELTSVTGNGPSGRISHEDLDSFIERGGEEKSAYRQARMGSQEIKLIGMRRKIAEAMLQAKRTIPHFSYIEECDVTELEALRKHLNNQRHEAQVRLTILSFLMQALIKVVPKFPQVNANFDTENGILHRIDALHIGIATQTPQGLLVPVIHHAETMDIWECAARLQRSAQASRDGSIGRQALMGSSITISSLGAMGGVVSTPIINAPNVAIIGVNKIIERPMMQNGLVVPRLMMNLSSSFDHRIVDGWDAAGFIQAIKSLLEHPATLFME